MCVILSPSLSRREARVKHTHTHNAHTYHSRVKLGEERRARIYARAHTYTQAEARTLPCKKAGGNHDQARIWASKVRVRTQPRTRNAITRVSKSPSRSGRPFLASRPCLPTPFSPPGAEYAPRNVREKFCQSAEVRTCVLDYRKKIGILLPFTGELEGTVLHCYIHRARVTQAYTMYVHRIYLCTRARWSVY